jgi:hypothetical protein
MEIEKQQELEGLLEDASNGKMAERIRKLDLSGREGRDEFRYLLSPWQESGHRANLILDKEGKSIFSNINEIGNEDRLIYALSLEFLLEEMGTGLNLAYWNEDTARQMLRSKALDSNGHCIVKIGNNTMMVFSPEIDDLNPFNELNSKESEYSNFFVANLGHVSDFVSETLNFSYTGHSMRELVQKHRKNEKIEEHPNYSVLMELIDTHKSFFNTWNETFFRYLSNYVQDSDYKFPGSVSPVSEEDVRYHEEMCEEGHIFDCPSFELGKPFREKMENNEFDEAIEDRARAYIGRIRENQVMFEGFNAEMPYAVPQGVDE